jgi:hypothetical protein
MPPGEHLLETGNIRTPRLKRRTDYRIPPSQMRAHHRETPRVQRHDSQPRRQAFGHAPTLPGTHTDPRGFPNSQVAPWRGSDTGPGANRGPAVRPGDRTMWIIDGTYASTLPIRPQAVGAVVFPRSHRAAREAAPEPRPDLT